jgi:hypothetical protein
VKITAIRLDRMRLPLDPPLRAAWDDGGLTLDEEGSWIPPTLLVPRPVPARSAPRAAPA